MAQGGMVLYGVRGWYGVVCCGAVWIGVDRCGAVRYGRVLWCGVVWCGVVRRGAAWCVPIHLHVSTPPHPSSPLLIPLHPSSSHATLPIPFHPALASSSLTISPQPNSITSQPRPPQPQPPPPPTLAEELVANLRSEINMNPQTDHQKFHMTVAGVAPVGEVTPEALAQFRAAWVPPRPADAVGMPPVRYGLMRNEQTQTLNERGGVDGS